LFRIHGTDKRKEFVKSTLIEAQQIRGKKVEYFSPETGFILLEKVMPINYTKKVIQRAKSAAKLSLGTPLSLREFYYTLRVTPSLVKAFKGANPDAIYPMVLRAISDVEILCDIGREYFTVGNLSKGFIYYFHSEKFSDKDRMIAFTENIARSALADEELEACENIIVIEKNAAATRLVDLGMSELTNSVIVTVGGNFNRAIWALTDRFKDSKNIIYFCDADAYGVDMLRTIAVGTMNSRHLPFKFPPEKNSGIYLAGLYPSVGESLGLPNDVQQKRPLANPYVQRRISFLLSHGLLNQQDYDTWMRDKTYELESLSTAYKSRKNGKPIGLAIHLIEYMRLFGIPVKPPLPPDDKLEKDFREAAYEELKTEIDNQFNYPDVVWTLYYHFEKVKKDLIEEIFEDLKPEYDEALDDVTAQEIKYHIYKQFEADPNRATYDLKAIAHKLKVKFNISVDWIADLLTEKVDDALKEYKEEVVEFVKDVIFAPIHNESTLIDAYDLILQKLGADPEDCRKVREALEKRFKK